MSKRSRRRLRGVAIFIVFLALAVTIFEMNRKESRVKGFDFKESYNAYRDLKFVNKANISFHSGSVPDAKKTIDRLISEQAKQQLRKQDEGSYGAYIFSVPQAQLSDITSELYKVGSISSFVEMVDTSLVSLDIESESARLASYEKEKNDLDQVRFPSDVQNRRKETLHALIHQSRNNLDKLREAENVLLYITLSPARQHQSIWAVYKGWLYRYLFWLLMFTVSAILVYFGTRLIGYILALMGIKGINLFGQDGYTYGGYYSNYAGYTSRYARNRRKIKRVYKDKTHSSDSEDSNTD